MLLTTYYEIRCSKFYTDADIIKNQYDKDYEGTMRKANE
jgi:hypothetical protein